MKVSLAFAGCLVVSYVSCSSLDSPSSQELTSAEYRRFVPNDEAIVQLTTARCGRELTCENIGPKKRFASIADCTRRVHRDLAKDLGRKSCPRGVNRTKVLNCAAVAREERCDSVLDTIDRTMSCQRTELCRY